MSDQHTAEDADRYDGPCYHGCMCSHCKDRWICTCLIISRFHSDCILHPSIFDPKEAS